MNLPPFRLEPPVSKTNWQSKTGHGDADLDKMVKRLKELRQEGLEAADLVAMFIQRRVLPLQRRPHRICDMAGHLDCTRTSTMKLAGDEVRERVRAITELTIPKGWWFGMHAYTQKNPPPEVTVSCLSLSFSCSCAELMPRLVPL